MRRLTTFIALLAIGLLIAAPAYAARGGAPGSPIIEDLIWADGEQLGTILQKELTYNGNEASYDRLFMFAVGEGLAFQAPVAEAAPGNKDYNGGRWLPTMVAYDGTQGVLESYADLMAAIESGAAEILGTDYGAAFLCPLIPSH